MQAAEFFVGALAVYGLAGAVFAVAFVCLAFIASIPLPRTPLSVRLIVIPGVSAPWPLLLGPWLRARRSRS
jgi:hypothetical protein